MKVRVRDVIDTLKTPAIDREKTVDQLLYGDPDAEVKQIAVTFLASARVIEEAKKLGVNLIISHEGIYYSHFDRSEMLKSDPVYLSKHKLIEDSGIAIFRNHDHVHLQGYDGITRSLVASLGWLDYELESSFVSSVLALDKPMTLREVISHIKNKLGLTYIRYTGDLETSCRRIGVLVGYRGSGENVIPLVAGKELDLVIYGEGPEWESPEYIKDANLLGMDKALLVLGHAESEIPGMEQMAKKLQQKYPEIPVHFIRDEEIFKLM